MAALVLISILTPPLGVLLRPHVTEAIVGLLCIAFMRININSFKAYARSPAVLFVASVWTTVGVPILFAVVCMAMDVDTTSSGLFTGLILQAVASPMMAAPAFAAIMGLDATLVLITLVISTAVTPFTAPIFVSLTGLELTLSPLVFGFKLFAILAGSAIIGLIARRWVGQERIHQCSDELDGINILLLLVFVSAVMGNVGIQFLDAPFIMFGLVVLAFVVYFTLLGISYLVFIQLGRSRSLALALMTTQRNTGLMLAATGGILPEMTWFYFAVSQFPIYLSPLMMEPVSKRIIQIDRGKM